MCCDALIGSGYHVDMAVDGQAGWRKLQAASYDLLITDNNMPNLSGVELIRKLRATGMPLPVILASGMVPSSTEDLHLAAILQKPFTTDQLVRAAIECLTDAPHEVDLSASVPIL
jgi:DNA-binding response OmpR family regulator